MVAGIVFNKLFFPASDPVVATLLAYTTFAVGFVTRPLGGMIFGHFGDRIGRKSMLVLTLMIMGVATFLIGLVPTYEQIGIAAPILLLVLRMLQGIGLGGEWGGAVLMAYEYAPAGQARLLCQPAADRPGDRPVPGVGRRRAAVVAAHRRAIPRLGLARRLPISASSWSASASTSGSTCRRRRSSPRSRRRTRELRIPFIEMIRRYPGNILKGMGARYIDGVFFNVFAVFSIAYLTSTPSSPAHRGAAGRDDRGAGDVRHHPAVRPAVRPDRPDKVYIVGLVVTGALGLSRLLADEHSGGNVPLVWLAMIMPFGILYASIYGPEAALFCDLFDAQVRYTGISFVYQFSGIFASGITPIVATALLKSGGGEPWQICMYVLFAGVVSAISAGPHQGAGRVAPDPARSGRGEDAR